jgi:hypothetical protein
MAPFVCDRNFSLLFRWKFQAQQTAAVHIQIQGAITRFLSADFPKNTFVAEGFGFFSATFLYRF